MNIKLLAPIYNFSLETDALNSRSGETDKLCCRLRESVHFDRYGYGPSMKNILLGLYILLNIYHQSNVL